MTDITEITAELTWSKPKLVMTKHGERIVTNASPTERFWEQWRKDKTVFTSNGYSLSKDQYGKWSVAKWDTPKDAQEKEQNLALSKDNGDLAEDVKDPPGLTYYPYQKSAIKFSRGKPNVLLADAPGLGKTLEAIGIINETPCSSVLIVCPATIKINWTRELRRALLHPLSITIITAKTKADELPKVANGVYVINYELLVKFEDWLRANQWSVVVADECHKLKNPKSQRSDVMSVMPANRLIYMTGTPIVNRPKELFPLISALDPERWTNFFTFAKRYCGAYHDGHAWNFNGASNLEELQDRLRSTIMVRRLKEEVLTELPPKLRQVIEIEPTSPMKKLLAKEAVLEDEEKLSRLKSLVELSKASDDPTVYDEAVKNLSTAVKVSFAEMSQLRQELALLKVSYVVDHIKSSTTDKCVVFAHHREVIEQLYAAFPGEAVMLYGGMKESEKQEAIDRFQTDPTIKVFVGSILAAGVGITLTAASHVVFAELDWVPGNMTQCEDRCHRIGQRNSVLVQHLVVDGSIDAKMAHTLVEKQKNIEKALDTEYELDYADYNPSVSVNIYPTKKALEKETEEWTPEAGELEDLHNKLKTLAAMDSDRASVINGIGFSKLDQLIGHSLANSLKLTKKQGVIAKKLVYKYRRQLGID